MPIIPRYQARGGPRLQTLDYAGAYQPPGGEDWRMLAQAARAGGAIIDGAQAFRGPPDLTAERDVVKAKTRDVAWRREQLQRPQADVAAVARSRDAAGEGLEPAALAAFDLLTGPREAGFAAVAAGRAAAEQQTIARQLSEDREALGVDEYVVLADLAPDQARAALGSAIGELTGRLAEMGAGAEAIDAGRRGLLNAAVSRRIRQVTAIDPDRAATLIQIEGGVLDSAAQAGLRGEVEAEQTRRAAHTAVQRLVAEHTAPEDDLDGLLAGAEALAGSSPGRQEAFRGAAIGAWRAARLRREASEDAAWAAAEPYLDPARVPDGWTAMPGDVWTALSPRQQAAVRGRFEAPWRGSDPAVVRAIEATARASTGAFADLDLTGLLDGLGASDLARLRGLQLLARDGGADWEQAREALPQRPETGQDPMLIKAAWGGSGLGGLAPQGDLSEREKNLNRYLDTDPFPADGLYVNAQGQVVRRVPRRLGEPLSLPLKSWSEEVVSDEIAAGFRATRLGVDPRDRAGLRSREDQLLEARFPDLAPSAQTKTRKERSQLRRRRETGEIFDRTPEVRAWARVIAEVEGGVDYNSMGGDKRGVDYKRDLSARYPGRVSGRYQINNVTWKRFGVEMLGATDYSPRTQDMAYVALLQSRNIDDALLKGDFDRILEESAKIWASIPDPVSNISNYEIERNGKSVPQPHVDRERLEQLYRTYLEEERSRKTLPPSLPTFYR